MKTINSSVGAVRRLALTVLLCAVVGTASAGTANEPMPSSVALGSSDASGPIYTTAAGMTLYTTELDDGAAGTFGCTDARFTHAGGGSDRYPLPRKEHRPSCVERWPPFLAEQSAKPVGRWTIVKRPDQRLQWAYGGQPLYLSRRDTAPGEVNGTMGFERFRPWKVVPQPRRFPPGVKLVQKVDGLMLGDNSGRLLLAAGAGTKGKAKPDGGWSPLLAAELDAAFDDWQIVTREDGGRQWAYKNMPLFASHDDGAIQKNVAAGQWQPIVFQKARERPEFVTMQLGVPEIGWVYANAEGRTLYVFTCTDPTPDQLPCDEVGDPAAHRSALCGTADRCAREWRPVLAAANDKPVGNWGIAQVPDPPFVKPTDAYGENVPMVRAWTYFGRPVYTFSVDKNPGDTLGHSIEATASSIGALTVLGDEFPIRP